MDKLIAELRDLCEKVSDKYDDFVDGMCCTLRHHGSENAKKVIAYIKENPDSKTDDIIEYLDVLGI